MDANEELKNELVEYQQLQQQLQVVLMQSQQVGFQIAEIEKVSEELAKGGSGKLYRFAGSVLVEKSSDQLKKDLKEEKDDLDVKKQFLDKQEKRVRERMDAIKKKFDSLEKGAKASKPKE